VTSPAAFDAFVHAADFLATFHTGFTNYCAGLAVVSVIVAVSAHEVNACGTSRGAVAHYFDMRLLDTETTFGQTRRGQHVVERCLTLLAVMDTVLHGSGRGTHGNSRVKGDGSAALPY